MPRAKPAAAGPPAPPDRRANQRMLRLDGEILDRAKLVCTRRGISLTDYFAEHMRPIIDRDVARLAGELAGGPRRRAGARR